ncbi:MAG: HAMP domain-containing sensor histidine kinase [Oscillospiraceae bacterium]|nr:HAMP domain-containing sensor histidine kinase [Oscillospiraceae bacterium]MDD4368488.1 HAMP domain-containing sensor histidine kinase [Oscillospiraceae bacterium]
MKARALKLILRRGSNLWLLLVTDLFSILVLWLASPAHLLPLAGLILLFTSLTLWLWLTLNRRRARRQLTAWQNWLRQPEAQQLQQLQAIGLSACAPAMLDLLQEQKQQLRQLGRQQQQDRQFVEVWAHEVKTPLALLSLLQNHYQSQLPPKLDQQLQQIQQQVKQSVSRLLYYNRLENSHPDYRLLPLDLADVVAEALADISPLAIERGVRLDSDLATANAPIVCSDRRILLFILGQLLDNACKYAAVPGGSVKVTIYRNLAQASICLIIQNNGPGVSPEDLPFLFDKGFTGNHAEQAQATGFGLYLVRHYAGEIAIQLTVDAASASGQGFGIQLQFPEVKALPAQPELCRRFHSADP